mmetsp:Transcript_7098/g.12991  ORF Transcript_7098/g.12991 Transcript_7098/m.12991 type:complete len:181 (-) Transcript_7098:1705-2247(-)
MLVAHSVNPSNLRWTSYKADKAAQIKKPYGINKKHYEIYCPSDTRIKQIFRFRRNLFKLGVPKVPKPKLRSPDIKQTRSVSVNITKKYSSEVLPSLDYSHTRTPTHFSPNLDQSKLQQDNNQRLPKLELITTQKRSVGKLRIPVISKVKAKDTSGSLSPWKAMYRADELASPGLNKGPEY